MAKYLITGANGGLGASILRHLLASGIRPASITATSTRAEAASQFESFGVNFRQVDFDDENSLTSAFSGVENVFFVSTNTFNIERRTQQHKNVVSAAKIAGVEHLWYSSLAFGGYGSHSKAVVQQAHLATEKMMKENLAGSQTIWTSVREGLYMDAFPLFLNWYPTDPKQILYLPDDGGRGIAWASREELGEATAKLMIRGGHHNEIVLLTGPRSQTYEDIVSVINESTGRHVTIQKVSSAEYIKINTANDEGKKPEGFFQGWLTAAEGLAQGEGETVSLLMEELLGREPMDGKQFVQKELEKNPNYTWHQNYFKETML